METATTKKLDPHVHLALMTAIRIHDEKLIARERKAGHVANMNRFAILCRCLNDIQESVEEGKPLRAAILGETCGAVARALLKAAKLAPMTKEEGR